MSTPSQLKRPPPDDGATSPSKKQRAAPDQERIQKMVAEARARASALAAELAAKRADPSRSPATAAPATTAAPMTAAERLAAIRARVSSAVSRSSAAAAAVPTRPAPSVPFGGRQPEPEPEVSRARGGLDVGLHPALLGEVESGRAGAGKKAMLPKFATTMANRRDAPAGGPKGKKQLDLSGPPPEATDPTKNPYYDPSILSKPSTTRRAHKVLVFNQKGKYIEQANALRRQEALEAMKKRIAESARKVGIDEDMHADKAFKPEEPPSLEWWDQGLVNGSEYGDLEPQHLKIDTPDSIITLYIQHPILIEPPQERHQPPPKPLPLTKKEAKKKRRHMRAEKLKEQQAKQRLGLEPAPPPKVKIKNMMTVLGDEAIKDPTAVEARVKREIAEREQKHLQENESRKLTKEQRHEKLLQNQQKDLQMGIHCLVFRIENLTNGKHQFKINMNAQQLALTGICIYNPKFNLVIVEGGAHSIKFFKKLMLNRIDWTQDAGPAEGGEPDEMGRAAVDIAHNKCTLIWEGELKQRGFRKFSSEKCPTDAVAKERLERANMQQYWTQAKTAVQTEE